MNTPKATIQKELNIGHTQYYSYIDAAEEIADDFVLGFVDHGLVLQFTESMTRMHSKVLKLDKLAETALDDIAKIGNDVKPQLLSGLNNIVRNYILTERVYNDMLDDSKIVNQTMKTLNKVIVNNAQNKKKWEE